jgi:HTH-type transcriptional regulator / antitoxin HigA
MELFNFLPRPIATEVELFAIQHQINSLLDKTPLTQDDRDYLKVLGTLVYDYEEKHEPMPILRGIALLKALMEESDLQPIDLIPIFDSESAVVEILNCQRQLTEQQTHELAKIFHVPAVFLQ